MGAVTQSRFGEVKFHPIPPDTFSALNGPVLLEIAWTLEAEPLGPELTRFGTQTRLLATDDIKAFRKKSGIGILTIRRLAVPASGGRRNGGTRHG